MECKVVLVGDVRCGKTALIHRFTNDNFLQVYTPTGFERYTASHDVGSFRIDFTLWDTSGAGAYDTVRPLCYQDAKVFLVCFDVTSQVSLHNALKKWYPEVRKQSEAPIVLCGCKGDLLTENKQLRHPVTTEQATAVSKQIGAVTYVETSSKAVERTVVEVFEVAALAATGKLNKHRSLLTLVRNHAPHLKHHLRPQRACSIM